MYDVISDTYGFHLHTAVSKRDKHLHGMNIVLGGIQVPNTSNRHVQ